MSNELAVISAVQGVTSTITSLVSTFSALRIIRKGDIKKLEEQIEFARRSLANTHMTNLLMLNLNQLQEVNRLIESYNLSPEAKRMAMQHLEMLNQALMRNFNDFANGF